MIKIYNSLSRQKEEFVPINEGKVSLYACGVTPYDDIHIGHAMQAVVYDVIRAYFEYIGYEVKYIRNFTDVDDKIINRANRENQKSDQISEHFIKENLKDLEQLNVHKANYEPKVTECMEDIVQYIQVLIDKGYAYEVDGEVFFDIDKFKEYGKLSNRKRDDLINSEESTNKKNSNDFVLWKPHKPGEPYWESPWSKGRPGWHIECSVMVNKYLGDAIDIHGGGLDLIFPHHENEVAQSEAYSGKQFAKYWVHNGLVMVNGTKMSKSLGNFLTVKDALSKYFPDEIRYAILVHNYSSNIDFSDELFLNARKRVFYFYSSLLKISGRPAGNDEIDVSKLPECITGLEQKFRECMDDNFNTPRVISEIAEGLKELNKIEDSNMFTDDEKNSIYQIFLEQFKKIAKVLRLFEEDSSIYLANFRTKFLQERGVDEKAVEEKIAERQEAKERKDYKRADEIKENLIEMGILIQDLPGSVKWNVNIE